MELSARYAGKLWFTGNNGGDPRIESENWSMKNEFDVSCVGEKYLGKQLSLKWKETMFCADTVGIHRFGRETWAKAEPKIVHMVLHDQFVAFILSFSMQTTLWANAKQCHSEYLEFVKDSRSEASFLEISPAWKYCAYPIECFKLEAYTHRKDFNKGNKNLMWFIIADCSRIFCVAFIY